MRNPAHRQTHRGSAGLLTSAARAYRQRAMRIIASDIGGTHARFCVASISAGSVPELGEPVTMKTADHSGLAGALAAFISDGDADDIEGLAIAFAGPVGGETLKLTNSNWVVRTRELAFERLTIVNDFGAVAHAVAALPDEAFRHLCGPDRPLPREGVVSIAGPGTGLGSAILLRKSGGRYRVIETEAGHIGFAPTDEVEDDLLRQLRKRFGRVSVERLASGPGLAAIHAAGAEPADERGLWAAAIEGGDPAAREALERLCLILGSAVGDLALAQGAEAVVIAGGIGQRLADRLPGAGFCTRFVDKGRYRQRMEAIPVKLIDHPQPGLLGAAAAFAKEHCPGEAPAR